MKLLRLPALLLVRRVYGELRGIRECLQRQTVLLERLVDHLAPLPPAATDQELIDTGVSFVDPVDQLLIQQYVARCETDTGHTPTDDEILSYLSDEKTRDLHLRMIERDQEIERIARERRR